MPLIDGIFRMYGDTTNLSELGVEMETKTCKCGKTFRRMVGSYQDYHSEVCRSFNGRPEKMSEQAQRKIKKQEAKMKAVRWAWQGLIQLKTLPSQTDSESIISKSIFSAKPQTDAAVQLHFAEAFEGSIAENSPK